jgi:hypothetical protein
MLILGNRQLKLLSILPVFQVSMIGVNTQWIKPEHLFIDKTRSYSVDSTDWKTANLWMEEEGFEIGQFKHSSNPNFDTATHLDHRLVSEVPKSRQKSIGNISYDNPTFLSETLQQSWGAGQGLAPQLWFWENVPQYYELKTQINNSAAKLEAQDIIPYAGLQLWQETYNKSQPGGEYANLPGHQEWVQWLQARPEYLGVDLNGKDFGWGYVSPLVPLNPEDYPKDFKGNIAYYADWQADRIGRLAAFTGVRGVAFSDYFDSHPHTGIENYFNARIIDDFERATGIVLSSKTLTEQAQEIRSQHYSKWLDYWVDRWAYNWSAIDREISKNTGKEALLLNQTSFTPAVQRRFGAVDPRVILQKMSPDNIIFVVQTINGFVVLHLPIPESFESASIGLHAAREPEAHYQHILTSSENGYWEAVKDLWPGLNQKTQQELGWKRLKRTWLESGWTHVATRQGNIRRAAESWSRSFHDLGTIDDKWVKLLRDIDPTRPFGSAMYYSVGIEHGYETYYGAEGNISQNSYLGEELKPVTNLKENGVPFNYYVSDAALNKLSNDIAPTAWIIPDRYLNGQDLLPQQERQKLEEIAPILTEQEAQNYDYPLSFSSNQTGRTIQGFGFYDQNDRLIVVASDHIKIGENNGNLEAVQAIVNLKLPDGSYIAHNLLSNQDIAFQVVSGSGKFTTKIDRWDTQAFKIKKVAG